jgi:hypothetical protein
MHIKIELSGQDNRNFIFALPYNYRIITDNHHTDMTV